MKSIAVLLCALVASCAVSCLQVSQKEWTAFKEKYNKKYNSETEEKNRQEIYANTRDMIAKHNERFARGEVTYRLEYNQFADMTNDEFKKTMTGFRRLGKQVKDTSPKTVSNSVTQSSSNAELPAKVDWRDKGAITAVKDQLQCASCWAFTATGALEAHHFLKTGKLVTLSEQNLIDCTGDYNNHGCDGGVMQYAFTYIKDNGGIDTEESYPYEAVDGECRYDPKNSGASDSGYVQIPYYDEDKLKEAVANVGPISAGVDASQDSFHFYKDGVYYNKNCTSEILDHAVLVVGYGTDKFGGDYWLVKNSWGVHWGENGYMKIARNRDNNCGIATEATYPIV